ncbi:hypothetical protein AKO1_015468 [Acrasis kona]|uniref:Peptidase M14 domain-containing protein n=1 Tax=Acrasis kona TaxID=1008807 RepID=A0AAW2ZHM8_9EUKA
MTADSSIIGVEASIAPQIRDDALHENNITKRGNGVLLVIPTNNVAKKSPKRPKTHASDFEGLMIPGPDHISDLPKEREPIYKQPEDLKGRLKTADQLKKSNVKFTNRVVYDSIAPNPFLVKDNNEDSSTAEMDDEEEDLQAHRDSQYTPSEYIKVKLLKQNGEDVMAECMDLDEERILLQHEGILQGCQQPYYMPTGPEDSTLIFESRFESGNLRRATLVAENEYDLHLNNDKGTRGHTQWFYFAVSNMAKGRKYKFNIVNLLKPDSLFNIGLRPLIYSTRYAQERQVGWYRGGYDICYYKNKIKKEKGDYYTLTWTFSCETDDDTYFFTQSYPYTYSLLQKQLHSLDETLKDSNFYQRELLCKSMGDLRCDMLTITSPDPPASRPGVILTARVHPGEVNASWMMKGAIEYLTSNRAEARELRDRFVFKIIPMINPDGVVYGNYRCNLAGADLNRKYDDPSKERHPTILHVKKLAKKFSEERNVELFCDMHGHSRKKNIFMYGCLEPNDSARSREIRIFPKLLSTMSDLFNFKDCSFNLSKLKLNTGRIVMYSEVNIMNSFTMEASFCGCDYGRLANLHFLTSDLEEMGKNLLQALLVYRTDQQIVNSLRKELGGDDKNAVESPCDGITSLGSDDGDNTDMTIIKTKKYKKTRKLSGARREVRKFQELMIHEQDDSGREDADDEQDGGRIKYTEQPTTPRKLSKAEVPSDKSVDMYSRAYSIITLFMFVLVVFLSIYLFK